MSNIETIYHDAIQPLPKVDQIRLAEIILEHVNSDADPEIYVRALDLLEQDDHKAAFEDADEIDRHLRAERESWGN